MQLKNYGKVRDAVQEAIKYKESAEVFHYGAMSRFHTENWNE
jgi:hypothetical protein